MRKRRIALLLCLLLVLPLTGCGKSEYVLKTEELIGAIGEVDADSQADVEVAEAAYNALTEKDRAKVENASVLTEARDALDSALRVRSVEKQIAALGEISLDSQTAVEAAEAAYAALSTEEQSRVADADTLKEARTALEEVLRLEELRVSLLGAWVWDVDLREFVLSDLEEEGLNLEEFLTEEIILRMTMKLREDGTYSLYAEPEDVENMVNSAMTGIMPLLKLVIIQSIGEELAAEGVPGDYSTQEGLEQMLGMTLDEALLSTMGMDLDTLLAAMMEEQMDFSELAGDMREDGRFSMELEKSRLHFSQGLDSEPEEDIYVVFNLDGDVMTFLGGEGEETLAAFYPVILHRAA